MSAPQQQPAGSMDLSDYVSRFLDLATYVGDQPTASGGHVEVFNLRRDIPGHPKDSTVTKPTLDAYLREQASK